ncbi:MAG: LON peptidase substrate-binding domain-containing protein [Candidatus Eisenbacteria bacterium]|uniref:LON peptidase substrate-binding domain-containing protein n=1 Tax=Eiseniibacteriota bacterium TaxID=2212470 RepID=A0A956LXB0_UNCEI|nr:LON peptidase substrate-binding domain-containing protein [Candidatus Eisenbacteria bacterium]
MGTREIWRPLFPLQLVLFPEERLPLHIFEERYQQMIRRCQTSEESFGVVLARGSELARVGCEAALADVLQHYPDGRSDIVTVGGSRFACQEVRTHADGYLEGRIGSYEDIPSDLPTKSGELLLDLLSRLRSEQGREPDPEDQADPIDPSIPGYTFRIAAQCPMEVEERQALLELRKEGAREESLLLQFAQAIPRARQQREDQFRVHTNGHLKHS